MKRLEAKNARTEYYSYYNKGRLEESTSCLEFS